jgi:L-2-hydroxycarboxylate dehydrogenase (NAD+)
MTAEAHYAWTDEPRFAYETLHEFVSSMFVTAGLARGDAELASTSVLIADLRGVETHGVQRVAFYLKGIENGSTRLDAKLTVVEERASTIAFDGGHGLGLLNARKAMERCIEKAEETGICLATVRNSSHFGIAGMYPLMAAERGMCGMAMTNTTPIVVPMFAKEGVLGTNPIAFAAPTGGAPFCLDMSTSTVAWGKIEVARRLGIPIPEGWSVDSDGQPTTDPFAHAGLAPLGGNRTTSGHKGYGLGLMVEIFCGQLAGNPWSKHLGRTHAGGDAGVNGHMFMAWRVDAFRDQEEFRREMDEMVTELRAMEVSDTYRGQTVLVPGDPELEAEAENRRLGLPVRHSVLAELNEVAARLGVDPLTRG